jgi:hypothetical protein
MRARCVGAHVVLARAAALPWRPSGALAYHVPQLLGRDDIRACVSWRGVRDGRVVESLVSLASIGSPSDQEQDRGRMSAQRMRAIGLEDAAIDAASNVVRRIRGRSDQALVIITALDHLGASARLQRPSRQRPHREGDRVVFDEVRTRAAAWVDVLGNGEEIVYGAGTPRWWKVVAHGQEGHTEQVGWPSVSRRIARAADRILALRQPHRYEDSFMRVGITESGTVYNDKRGSGSISRDVRSIQRTEVKEIDADVAAVLQPVHAGTGVRFDLLPATARDSGQVPEARSSHPVQLAAEVSRHPGLVAVVSLKNVLPHEHLAKSRACCHRPLRRPRGQSATPGGCEPIRAMIQAAEHVALLAAAC